MFRLSVNKNISKLHRLAPQVGRTEHAVVLQQQKRHAGIFTNTMNKFKSEYQIDAMKKKVNTNPNDENLVQYFQALNSTRPREVIINIEKGWATGTVPITEPFLKQYFAAAAKLGKLETLNISGLLAILARGNIPAAAEGTSGAITEAELSALIRSSIASNKGGVGGNSGAGSTAATPLYVTK